MKILYPVLMSEYLINDSVVEVIPVRILIALLTRYETFTIYDSHPFLTYVVHVHFLKYNEEYIAQIPNGYVRYEVTNWT